MRAQHVREGVICGDVTGNRHNMHAQVTRKMEDVARLWRVVGELGDGDEDVDGDEEEEEHSGDDDGEEE
jgi:phosphopantothenoylcysteine synthetase/decarboxylase